MLILPRRGRRIAVTRLQIDATGLAILSLRRKPNRTRGPMTTPEDTAKTVDPRLLEVLVCPLTKTTLRYDRERQELISDAARLAFPIRDGVPIMLPDEARALED